jgi:hypothetical protein
LELRTINGGNGPKRNGKHIAAKGLNTALTYGPGREVDRGLGATVVPLEFRPLTLENHYSILRESGFLSVKGEKFPRDDPNHEQYI